MGISLDGVNPVSIQKTQYSVWPVIVINYNIPPYILIKKTTHDVNIIGTWKIPSEEYGYLFATFNRGVKITKEWSCDP